MPNLFRIGAFRVFFYSAEGDPREPVHVHARSGRREVKLWVDPTVRLASNNGVTKAELKRIEQVVNDRADEIRRAWNDHFAD